MTAATEFLRQCAYIIAVIAAETALYIRFRLFVEEAGHLCAQYALQIIDDGIQLLFDLDKLPVNSIILLIHSSAISAAVI